MGEGYALSDSFQKPSGEPVYSAFPPIRVKVKVIF